MNEEQKLDHCIHQFKRLIELKAPNVIKAHYLTCVLIPKCVKMLNIVPEFAQELGTQIGKTLGQFIGVCSICLKQPQVIDDLCGKCHREMNELCVEMDSDTNELE